MKQTILFAGETEALAREFSGRTGADGPWENALAATGQEALALCARTPFAAVVTPTRLPDMTGLALLDALMLNHPQPMRVVLSDLNDVEATVQCIGRAHHHLLQPCNAATLLAVLEQAFRQEKWLPPAPVQNLISQMRRVPSPPRMYFQLMREIQSSSASLERIGELIAKDPAVSAKVLQLANSAVFALQHPVAHPIEAIGFIGLETTKAIVLLAHTYASFDELKTSGFSIEELWRHSVATGRAAQRIARLENAGAEAAEQSFAAGLLHDLGKLLMAANLPDLFRKTVERARAEHCQLWEAETILLPGADHAELGATFLGIWGVPQPITEAVALHHSPWRRYDHAFSAVTAVHAANVFERESQPESSALVPEQLNMAYLRHLGLAGRVNDWRHGCRE